MGGFDQSGYLPRFFTITLDVCTLDATARVVELTTISMIYTRRILLINNLANLSLGE